MNNALQEKIETAGIPVLWIDDHMPSFNTLAKGLSRKGYDITSLESISQLSGIDLKNYKYFIIDNKLGERSLNGGLELVDKLMRMNDVRVILYSAYITHQQISQRISERKDLNSFLLYIRKMPLDPAEVHAYFEGLASNIDNFFKASDADSVLRSQTTEPDRAKYTYTQFTALPLSEKERYYKGFESTVKLRIDEEFRNGAVWILFFDGDATPDQVVHDEDDIPPTSRINAKAESTDRVPFVFRNDFRIDDVGCHAWGRGGTRIESYPHIVLNVEGTDVAFHFDTGADTSFISERFIAEFGEAARLKTNVQSIQIHGKGHLCQEFEMDTIARSDQGGSSGNHVILSGFAVASWEDSSLHVRCHQKCTKKTGDTSSCLFRRNGLVGREVYLRNDIEVTMSAHTNRITIKKRD